MPGVLCEHCTAACCRYIALPIDTPTTRRDFDDIRWFMLHEGVTAYVEDGDWYLNIVTTCRHLQADNRCGIYETRPRVCREYTTDNCEYHGGDYDFQHHFVSPADLEAYERAYFRLRRAGAAVGRKREKRRRGVRARLGRRRIGHIEPVISNEFDGRGIALPILSLPIPALPVAASANKNGNGKHGTRRTQAKVWRGRRIAGLPGPSIAGANGKSRGTEARPAVGTARGRR